MRNDNNKKQPQLNDNERLFFIGLTMGIKTATTAMTENRLKKERIKKLEEGENK